MVIVYLYDPLNGYRYRHFGLDYYEKVAHHKMIVGAWIVTDRVITVKDGAWVFD